MGDVVGIRDSRTANPLLIQGLRIEIGRLRALLRDRLMSTWGTYNFDTGERVDYVACDGCHKKVPGIHFNDFVHDFGCDLAGPDMSLLPEGDE